MFKASAITSLLIHSTGRGVQVLEEEELAAMRAHQEHFEQVRHTELVATQKMEQAERRKVEEKERRMQQERARIAREKALREKIAAATFARGFLTGMVDSVIASLWSSGFFFDPVERAVKEEVLPWLAAEAQKAAVERHEARGAVAAMVAEAVAAADAARERNRTERRAQEAALAATLVRACCCSWMHLFGRMELTPPMPHLECG